jgi:hypothetical protein
MHEKEAPNLQRRSSLRCHVNKSGQEQVNAKLTNTSYVAIKIRSSFSLAHPPRSRYLEAGHEAESGINSSISISGNTVCSQSGALNPLFVLFDVERPADGRCKPGPLYSYGRRRVP